MWVDEEAFGYGINDAVDENLVDDLLCDTYQSERRD